MIPLTRKQKDLLDYLKSCETCPSFEEMREALGLRSKSGVHRLVEALEERGFIRRARDRARAIEVVEDPQLRASPAACSVDDLAREAKRRGLVLGHIYRDAYGTRKFEEVRPS